MSVYNFVEIQIMGKSILSINGSMARQTRADVFRNLHYTGNMLLLPKVWDPVTAALIEYCGFPAVATSGIAIAHAHGLQHGRQAPFQMVLRVLKRIVDTVEIPVSVEIDAGFSDEPGRLQENMTRVLDTGVAGVSFQDSHTGKDHLYSIDEQCRRIALIREAAVQAGRSVFINARVDTLVYKQGLADDEAIQEIITRSTAYLEAGADGIFPIFICQPDHVKMVLDNVHAPINLVTMPGIPPLNILNQMGVARFSLGPDLMNVAMSELKAFAEELQQYRTGPFVSGDAYPVTR
jgi:2-methylisocitrate lyase-like PEP mutase family enzyme